MDRSEERSTGRWARWSGKSVVLAKSNLKRANAILDRHKFAHGRALVD